MCRRSPGRRAQQPERVGGTPQAGEASAPNSAWSSSGLAIAASSAQVLDLLLGPVAAAADHVGARPARASESS